jgi:cytochrome c553
VKNLKINFGSKKHRFIFVVTSALFFMILLFQNCGRGGFLASNALIEEQMSLTSIAPPQISLLSPVPVLSNSKSLTLQLSLVADPRSPIKSVICQLDLQPAFDCSDLHPTFTNLSDGDHTVKINAADSNKQVALEQVVRFRTDATSPSVNISQAPAAVSGATTATLAFSSADALSGVNKTECSTDGKAFSICQSPVNLTGLTVGAHTLKIRATDNAGNLSTESTASWTVDLSAPILNITSTLSPITKLTTITFTFTGTASGGAALAAFECSMNKGAFAACTSPKAYTGLVDGLNFFSLRGRTAAGTLSSPINLSWTVDTIVPSLPVLTASIGPMTNQPAPSFIFSSTDAGSLVANYECSLDSAAFSVCISPSDLKSLSDGAHAFNVKANDNAGNASSINSFSWVQDTVLPTLAFTEKTTTNNTARFQFTATDSGSGIATTECQLDAAAFSICQSPVELTGLALGEHKFQVRAKDKAGNQQLIFYVWTAMSSVVDGAALYATNCASCHGGLATSAKIGRTAAQITTAIATVPSMSALKLSAAEVQAISDALKPVTGATTQQIAQKYFPSPELMMAAKRIFRLTRVQLDSTVKSLLPSQFSDSIRATMAADPLQTNYEYAEIINFNSSNFTPLTNWIQQVVDKVRLNPSSVINCTASNNSTACLQTQARAFILKAFRGDVSEEKINQFSNFLLSSVASVGITDATADFVDVVLNSPQFLFRYEYLTTTASALIPAELLQMTSYTLADAPPEQLNLSSATAATYVQTAASRKATVDQILASPQGREKLIRFFIAWLEVKEPANFTISTVDFPEFTPAVATAMVQETNQFLQYHLTKAAPKLKDLTQSTQSFVSQSLASIYGMSPTGLTGTTLVNVNPEQRLGIFFQPAVIASHSGPTTTRLVKRGVFFARKVMCQELGGVPAGVNTTLPMGTSMTERQKIESVTNQATCLGCHGTINPLGFFQENLSAIGRWRTLDNGLPIDPTAVFNALDEGPVNSNLPVETLKKFTASMMFKQCFVRQLFRFYMGRSEEPSDHEVLQRMFLSFVQNDDQDILTLLQTLSTSNRFSQR